MEANNQVSKKYADKKVPDLTNVTILNTPLPQATSTVDRRSQQMKSRRSTLDDPNSKHRQLNFDCSNANERSADESSLGIIQNISSLLGDSAMEDFPNKNPQKDTRELARKLLERCSDIQYNLPNKENNINSTNLQRNSLQSRPSNVRHSQSSQNRLSNVRDSQPLQNCLSNIIETKFSLPNQSQNQTNDCFANAGDSQSFQLRVSNVRESQGSLSNQPQNQTNHRDRQSIATSASINFEPNEMSGRSSEMNKTPEKTEPFPPTNLSGFSYNSNVADMMAQFGDEEFMSGSKAGSLISAGEMSWRQHQLSMGPVINNNNNEKDRLDLSCFSGIIGDVDLTVDSGRVSVGNYFQRKCGGTGHLSIGSTSDTPSFGLNAKSPQKKRNLQPLVDETVDLTVEESILPEEKTSKNVDYTIDPSVMSASSINRVLNQMTMHESDTPGKLVDRFLNFKKKKQPQVENNNNLAAKTYVLSPNPNRTSLPASSSYLSSEKPERDLGSSSFGSKFSLGSKNVNDLSAYQMGRSMNNTTHQESFIDNKLQQLLEMKLDDITLNSTKPDENKSGNRLSLPQNEFKSPNSSVPRAEQSLTPRVRQMSHLPEKPNKLSSSTSINNKSSLIHDTVTSNRSDPSLLKNDSTLKEDTLNSLSVTKNSSFETRKFKIGENTQELCTCLVGIPKEADFDLHNGTDRWIICSLKLQQIQGEKDNVQLTLPNEDILIEPDATKSFKIGVMMPRMGKLTIADFHIPCLDMVTRNTFNMKYLMCFVPEEPDIRISIPSEDIIMNFQTITEDTSSSLPITFENKNSIDIPIIVKICQGKTQLFSIGDCFDDTLSSTTPQRESLQVTLKPKQPLSMNIDFKGMSLQSFGEKALQNGLFNAEASLRIAICFRETDEYLVREIPLKGSIGSCKLDVIDSQFPLLLPPRMDRMVMLKNSGSIAVMATADIVLSKENQAECRDFIICPNNIKLEGGERLTLQISYKPENNKTEMERHAMLRLIVGNKVSFYPVIGEKSLESEQFTSDSFHQIPRCETPQRLRDVTSPTSPHSLMFNRSGTSGRYSPGSTASGGGPMSGTPIPIKASHTSLAWGSVRVGKSDVKKINVRNTSNNKIKLLVSVSSDSNAFKLLKERQSTTTHATLTLQGMENRSLAVVFTPNFPKAATGKISFSYCNSARVSREPLGDMKMIPLYGHGGCIKMDISEAVKDTSGQMWLSLGKVNSDGIQHAKLRLHNFGDITSFAKIKLTPKALHPSVSSWHVEPTELLLTPNQTQHVSVQFRPRKEDLAGAYQAGVIHVGTLKVTYGDEPTRLRIRRLYNKLKDSDQLQDNMNEQSDEFREVIYPLSRAFPGEVFPQDLRQINDSVQSLGDLCKGIVQNEVKLTVEVCADETISMLNDHMDESQAFYSLCSDRDESYFGGDSFLPTD